MPAKNSTLKIGSVTLGSGPNLLSERDLEVPDSVTGLGAEMLLSVHEYPGGTRAVQTHGPQPQEIRWSAKLLGPEALARALALKRLVTSETVVQFSWAPFLYDVVVKEFHPTVRHEWLIDYELALEPVRDRSDPSVTPVIPDAASSQATKTIQQMQTSLTATTLPASITGMAPTATAAGTGVTGAIAQVQADLDSAGGSITNMTPSQVSADRTALQTQVSALAPSLTNTDHGIAAAARVLTAQLQLLRGLLANPGTLQRIVKQTNPNLIALAAQYYGDPTSWAKIAKANNLVDPFPTGFFQLVIPR